MFKWPKVQTIIISIKCSLGTWNVSVKEGETWENCSSSDIASSIVPVGDNIHKSAPLLLLLLLQTLKHSEGEEGGECFIYCRWVDINQSNCV